MKKLFPIFLTCIVALCFMACGKSEEVASSNTGQETPTELVVSFITFGNVPTDIAIVEEEINKISLEKINTKVEIMPISIGAYMQQLNLMLTSGEQIDVFPLMIDMFSPLLSKGMLMPLNNYIDVHGKGIKGALGEYIDAAGAVDGQIYGLPTIHDFAASKGLLMRKDLVDKYNIDVDSIKTPDDVEEIFAMLKKNEPDVIPLVPSIAGKSPLYFLNDYDPLGDQIGVLMDMGKELNVVNLFETREYEEALDVMRKWYLAGYIYKDIATSKDADITFFRSGRGFSSFNAQKPGYAEQMSRQAGVPLVNSLMVEGYATSSTVQIVQWSIGHGCENPEKAMDFLNLMYTDKDLVNLFAWGIEGKHYEHKGNGVIGYPDGVNPSNTGYGLGIGWQFGNQFLDYVWEGDNPDIYNQLAEFNNNAVKSAALGFSFDPEPVKTEFTAVSNVLGQYQLGLETGTLDPEIVLPEFIRKLKAAGIDKIIAEKQQQLDAWVSVSR